MPHAIRVRFAKSCQLPRFAREFDGFSRWLFASGYSTKNVSDHLSRLSRVLEDSADFAPDKSCSVGYLHRRFSKYCISPWYIKGYRATEHAYGRYLDSQKRLQKSVPTVDAINVALQEYQRYLAEVRGLSASTVQQHGFTIYQLLSRVRSAKTTIAALTSAQVERYVVAKSKQLTRQSLQNVVARLRGFLRYALAHGLIPKKLDTIDTPRAYRAELPPRALPWPLVLRLLNSIDRSDGSGCRDYTILHLMAYYGLRSSEVVALTVDSIDWVAKTCLVDQRKTHSTLVLPLSDQTLTLVRRFLRHGRPKSPRSELFLREHRPATGMGAQAIGYIFRDRVRQSALHLDGFTSYSLRHAFAMRLLQHGVGVKAIGDLLGHHTLESTCAYLRLDISMLRDVALPLPRTPRAPA